MSGITNTQRCPIGTCDRCNELYRREQDAKCPQNPANLKRGLGGEEPEAVDGFFERRETLFLFALITGMALNDWHRHGAPFWLTVGEWAGTIFTSLLVLALFLRLAQWRDRWLARRAS